MAINPKDFMSTQTGGEGATIQAEIETSTPEQFKANIAPIQAPDEPIQQPIEQNVVEQPTNALEPTTDVAPIIEPEVPISEEDKIYADLGLIKSEINAPDDEIVQDEAIIEDIPTQDVNSDLYTEDGLQILSASKIYSQPSISNEIDNVIDESTFNDLEEVEDTPFSSMTEDGLSLYSPSADLTTKNKEVQSQYKDLGINVDNSGRVGVIKPTDKVYPKYKLPDTGVMYEKRPNGWYKDDGKGNFIKLKVGDVAQRSAYLDKNAIPVSELGTGTKNVQEAASIINQRVGPMRSSNVDNILTSGGDPTVSDGLSFNQLTKSNVGEKNEKYNPDGTLNFNYDPKYENVPREAQALIEYSGKKDGEYMYPGSSDMYKKENGEWYKKPKGSTQYFPITEGNVPERINNLEAKATPSIKVKDAVSLIYSKANATLSNLNKQTFIDQTLEGYELDNYKQSFEDAKNFVSKDLGLTLKDDMSMEQRKGLMDYQSTIKEIMGDGNYSTDKAIKISNILKDAEQFFTTSKEINKSINEAAQSGMSMARVSFENKKKSALNTFLTGKDSSDFQKEALDLFMATAPMTQFFLNNTDNGKIRFDSNSGQYVISKDISEIERKYLDAEMGKFIQQYNSLQEQKFTEANQTISKYNDNLSNVESNISKIEQSLNGMRNAGMKTTDPAYMALSKQLEKERKNADFISSSIYNAEQTKSAAFLTNPKETAKNAASNLSNDAKNIFTAIPSDIAPKQRFDLFYEKLQQETEKLMKDNGIGESRFSGMNMALKDLLDWDGFYALNDAEKRVAQNVATIRQLAPIYFNNDFGITKDSAGFWESFTNSFVQGLLPNIGKAGGYFNETEAAGKGIETFAEIGLSEEDFVDANALDRLKDRATIDFNSREKWGGMLGGTAAVILPILATRKLPVTALRVASNVEKLIITGTAVQNVNKTIGIIANAEKIYDRALSATKVGRFLKPAIESGVKFEAAGTVFNQEELSFLSGLVGGVASEGLSAVMSKLPKEQIYGYLNSIFGSGTDRVVNVIKSTANASARGIAETGEEFAEEVTNIYKKTDSFKGMMAELSTQFGTFDQVQEFVISSFILGAAFGIVDGGQGKDVLAKMPEEKRNQVNNAMAEINSSLASAESSVNEYVNNKLNQENVNKSIEENDSKNKEGVSGEVAKGEESVEGEPIVEAGQETPSPGGVVQEKQAGVEPTEESVIANSPEEAKALFDQGYRVNIEGVETRGGRDMAIDNAFNTRKQVKMTRMVTPEATVEPTPTAPTTEGVPAMEPTPMEPTAEGVPTTEPIVAESTTEEVPTEKKQITEKERFSENLSLSELDALRTAIRNKFPDSYTAEVLDDVAKAIRTGESNLPFELDYLSDAITLNDVAGILVQDEVFETGREVKNFLRERAMSGDFLKAKDEIRTEGVKQRTYEKLAEKIRSGKIDTRGVGMISIVPPQVLNTALEGVALTVETVGQVIEKIKESDWYNSLSNSSKPIMEREIARSLNNLVSKPAYTQQDAANEAYSTEFDDIYSNLLSDVDTNPNAANVNNLKAFTDNPKQFVQDLIDTGEIDSRDYENIRIKASNAKKSVNDYITDRIGSVESSISSDPKANADNIIARQHNANWRENTSAPFAMSEAISITSNPEKAKADGVTDEEIKEAQEYLADPIKYHQEIYELYNDNTKPYYNEENAQKALNELNYVKSVYERYGVDTGLTPEQSQQIDQDAENLPPTPKKPSRAKMTPEDKQAAADQRKAERERLKAEREAKKKADKEFGQKVAQVTGTAKPEKTVQRTEMQALKDSIRDREAGWKVGKKDIQDIKEQVRNYAKENLPKDDYSKAEVDAIMNAITNAKTPKGLDKALDRVDSMVAKKAEVKRKKTVRDINKKATAKRTLFSKSGNRWIGKVSIDAQKEFIDFINSPAFESLDTKTQEELDAINDVMDGILSEGKADYGAAKRLEQKAKRERAAQLISGIARGEEVILNGIDKVQEWLDNGNVVIINGQLFRKSDLKELQNQKNTLEKRKAQREKELNALNQNLATDEELSLIEQGISNIDNEINEAQDQITELERAIAETSINENVSFTGYKQRSLEAVKNANIADRKKWYKPRNWVRPLNPTNAISDIYSLLKSAYSGSSVVTKFVKNNLEKAIKKAYFDKQKAYQEKVASYYNSVADIFGSKRKGISYLSAESKVNPVTDKYVAKNSLVSNAHMADWYNLIRANENGVDRMNKSDVDAQMVISYVESNPELKKYADFLMNEYNTKLRSEYEPVHQEYTNSSFGDGTYYPSYASGFEDNFLSEDQVMGVDEMYNAMNATSRNLKQRVNYSGPFNTSMDAHAKFLDYIKTMEHAKNFMPIAKSANELFNKINSPYLLEQMGAQNFKDLKIHLGVILGDKPLTEFKGTFGKAINAFKNVSVIATLGLKPASVFKQYTSFTHYWIAGISEGVDPQKILTAVPSNKNEREFFASLYFSPYVKERFKGEGIDIEMKRLAQQAANSKSAKAWQEVTKKAMGFVRLGDIAALLFGPGGGTMFALAVYRKGIADGMSDSEARAYAYEKFVTETEMAQQSTREDVTSNIQRDPAFRLMAMYRTGQMAATKKVVNGIKTIYQAHQIEKNEGIEARQAAISDREIVQAITDIGYFTTLGSVFFNAVSSGALYYILTTDTSDDEEKRMLYDAAMDQIQSNLQGYGWQGFIGDMMLNYARGNEWMNNIPVFKFMNLVAQVPTTVVKSMLKEWPTLSDEEKLEYLKNTEASREITGDNQQQQLADFHEQYANQPFWSKLSDAEAASIIKAMGAGNVSKLIENTAEVINENKGIYQAIMDHDESYFEKNKKQGKRDYVYELIYGEPYLIDDGQELKDDIFLKSPMKKIEVGEKLGEKLD